MSTTETDRLSTATGLGIKVPCRVATTANITLYGIQTVDGVLLEADDRVLVWNQTDASENGIYNIASTSWQRARDFDGSFDATSGTVVRVNSGSTYGGLLFYVANTSPFTIGTDDIEFGLNDLRADADFTYPELFFAAGDGVTDDSSAFIAAVATGKPIRLTHGKSYRLNSQAIDVTDRELFIYCDGEATLVIGGDIHAIKATVTPQAVQTITTITNNVTYDYSGQGTNSTVATLLVSDGTAYSVGDPVKVVSDDLISGPDPADNERRGEFARVGYISGNTLYLMANLRDTYTTTPRVAKIPQYKAHIKGIKIQTASGLSTSYVKDQIRIEGYSYPVIENVRSTAGNSACLSLIGCYRPVVKSLHTENLLNHPSLSQFGYTCVSYGCEGGIYQDISGRNVRHVWTCGVLGTSAADSQIHRRGRTRDETVIGGYGFNNSGASFDTHADGEYIQFLTCVAEQPYFGDNAGDYNFTFRGRRNRAVACRAIGGYGFRAFQDYADANNSRDHEYIDCEYTVNGTYTGTNKYGANVVGSSSAQVTGIRFINFKYINTTGATTSGLINCLFQYADVYMVNPYFLLTGLAGTNTDRVFDMTNTCNIKVSGGSIIYTGSAATGMAVARANSDNVVFESVGLEVVTGGVTLRTLGRHASTTTSVIRFTDLKTDAFPTSNFIDSSSASQEAIGAVAFVRYAGNALTGTISIADDAVGTISCAGFKYGTITIIDDTDGTYSGEIYFKSTATTATAALGVGTNLNRTTGVLAGTTGTDAKVTVSVHTTNLIYIENRSGGTRLFKYAIKG